MAGPIWGASRGQALGAQSTEDLPSHWPGVKKGPHRLQWPPGWGAWAWAPPCQAFPPVTPTGMPEGAHWLLSRVKHLPSSHSPRATPPADLFAETPEGVSAPCLGGGGGVGKVWSPVPDLRAAAPSGGRSRLKPPRDARNPLTSSVFLSQAGFLLCQHMRYGDGEGISLNRDAVPFGNICLEVPTV